ncbi:hypothetical protein AB0D46_37220 [Streptomyces sp. NPDC048383]|uniref:hypothetical protein n=1 Tax=Streptomyces sp. NPDC048383 TaxID=3155386 RepID=UPI0034221DAB
MVTVNVRYIPPGRMRSDGVCLTLHAVEGARIELRLDAEEAHMDESLDEPEEIRYTIAQACDAGIIRKKAGTARQFKSAWIAAGKPFPSGRIIKGVAHYTREELESVFPEPAPA